MTNLCINSDHFLSIDYYKPYENYTDLYCMQCSHDNHGICEFGDAGKSELCKGEYSIGLKKMLVTIFCGYINWTVKW